MPATDVHAALQGLTTDHVHIDSLGRAVISDPAMVSKLSQAGVQTRPDLNRAAGNIICTGSMPQDSRELLQSVRNTLGGGGQ